MLSIICIFLCKYTYILMSKLKHLLLKQLLYLFLWKCLYYINEMYTYSPVKSCGGEKMGYICLFFLHVCVYDTRIRVTRDEKNQ